MKKETFEKAQELNQKIEDVDNALSRIERNDKNCNGFPLNFTFCYDEDDEALKDAVIRYLRTRKATLQKQFDSLK